MPPETLEDKISNMSTATKRALEKGWKVVFMSPSGTLHDLSAANLDCLDKIEEEGLFTI